MPPRPPGILASERQQRNTLWHLSLQLASKSSGARMVGRVPLPPPRFSCPPARLSWQPGSRRWAREEVSAVPCSGDSKPRQVASLAPPRPVRAGWGASPGKEEGHPHGGSRILGAGPEEAGERGKGCTGSAPGQTPSFGLPNLPKSPDFLTWIHARHKTGLIRHEGHVPDLHGARTATNVPA